MILAVIQKIYLPDGKLMYLVQSPEREIVTLGLSGGDNLDHKSCQVKTNGWTGHGEGKGGDRTPHSNIVGNGLQEGMVMLLRCVDRLMFGKWK